MDMATAALRRKASALCDVRVTSVTFERPNASYG